MNLSQLSKHRKYNGMNREGRNDKKRRSHLADAMYTVDTCKPGHTLALCAPAAIVKKAQAASRFRLSTGHKEGVVWKKQLLLVLINGGIPTRH